MGLIPVLGALRYNRDMDDQSTDRKGSGNARARGYSLQRLLVSVTFIAIGLAMIGYAINLPFSEWLTVLILIFVSGTLVGAGVMTPFKHPIIGALIGFVLTVAVIALWIIGVAISFFINPPHHIVG